MIDLTLSGGGLDRQLPPTVEPAQTADRADGQFEPAIVGRMLNLVGNKGLTHDRKGTCFLTAKIGGHMETHEIGSASFRRYVGQIAWKEFGKPLSGHALEQFEGTLKGRATYEGPEEETFLRIGQSDYAIYVDLGDPGWKVVEIRPEGWQVLPKCPIKFRRTANMVALPEPIRSGSISDLRPFINCTDQDFVIVVGFLLASFRPKGPYPILEITGEQGSAKSTTTRLIRSLVDPHAADLRAPVTSERDLAILAHNAWMVVGDNYSGLRSDLSDAFCRLATGGAFSTRKLYSDAEEQVLDYCRPAILNGIDDIASRTDLMSRCWCVELPRLTLETRRSESELWEEFDTKKGAIFGALLDALVCAFGNRKAVKLKQLDRLADAVQWVTAAEPSLGWEEFSFSEAVGHGRTRGARRALDQHEVLLSALRPLAQRGWSGTATDLNAALGMNYSAAGMGVLLRRLAPALLEVGIEINFYRQGKEATRLIALSAVCPVSAVSDES